MVAEPGYHFWVGNSSFMTPDRNGYMVANEKARFDDLQIYNGNDIIITLPKTINMFDINYLSIYNDETDDNLGHIQFDIRSNKIPPALGQTKKPGWWFEIPTTRYVLKYSESWSKSYSILFFYSPPVTYTSPTR